MKVAVDENFDNRILRGLLRVIPNLDVIRIQDTEIFGLEDPAVLEWCMTEKRVLLSYNYKTIPKYAYKRLVAGLDFAGIIMIPKDQALLETLEPEEWLNLVHYLPIGQ